MKKLYSLQIIKLVTSFIPRSLKIIVVLSLMLALTFYPGIYTLSAQVWTQVGSDIDGEAAIDWLGYNASLSTAGNRVAIGAHGNNANGTDAGIVRVYSESGGVWTQLGPAILGEAEGDHSGSVVVMSGDGLRVVVAAPNNDGNGSDAGHVRVYKYSGGTWTKQGPDIDGEFAGDLTGSLATSYDGKIVAIGARYNDGNGTDAGHVRVYKQNGNNWSQVGSDIDGEAAGDGSGNSVSISADGKRLAIGAPRNSGNGALSGHVRVYAESGGTWTQLGSDINGEASGDRCGYSVSLSPDGKRLAAGAIYNAGGGTEAGHVRVFSENGGVWSQVGADIDGEAPDDESGWSVSLSVDGKSLAIGARYNDGNGSDAGHVRVFSESGGVWAQVASDIDGEAEFDQSGSFVSLSGTGHRVAIGAPLNDGNGTNAGQARVYDETPCDVDMDGYDNTACGGSDCNDNNASINPGAAELCNGVDDNCNNMVDEGTNDADGDGVCDALDNCPAMANTNQANSDGDALGNVCDACPNDPNNDSDSDGICGNVDNCPSNSNFGQQDNDCDAVGNVCDVCPGGDDGVDNNNDGIPDCSQLLNYTLYSTTWKCGTNKIYVCHSGVTQCISKTQLSIHYNHGDKIGPCISCGGQNFNIPITNSVPYDVDELRVDISPNPANNEVTIYLPGFEPAVLLTISNQLGQVVWKDRMEEGEFKTKISLDSEQFSNGLYMVSVVANGKMFTQLLVVAR